MSYAAKIAERLGNNMCVRCNKNRIHEDSASMCLPCVEGLRSYWRKKRKAGKWHKGGRGRPPMAKWRREVISPTSYKVINSLTGKVKMIVQEK